MADISSEISLLVGEVSSQRSFVLRKQRLEAKESQLPNDLEDEYTLRADLKILKPQPFRVPKNTYFPQGSSIQSRIIEEHFAYYSRTRGLEIDTPRVATLQSIADKMTAGTEVSGKVVIMNKGMDKNAFVCADGTVFITQALLNNLDSEDEVAAVIGHELGHLIYNSHSLISSSRNGLEKLGIAWVHEAAADTKSRELLEKAGYNSFAFASAIRKIQGSERGTEHMSGLTRASQNVGGHFFIDSATSHQEEKPIPEIFHQQNEKTNLEIANALISESDPQLVRKIAEKLHPNDLLAIYLSCWNNRHQNYEKLDELNNLILSRLDKAGFSYEESVLMIISNPAVHLGNSTVKDSRYLDTPGKLTGLIGILQAFESGDSHVKMHKLIFYQDISNYKPAASLRILGLIRDHMYDTDFTPGGEGIPVTGDSLINILKSINDINRTGSGSVSDRAELNTDIISKYIQMTVLNTNKPLEPKEIERLEKFLTEVHDRGINIDTSKIKSIFYVSPKLRQKYDPQGNKQVVMGLCSRIFNIEITESGINFGDIDSFFENYEKGDYENAQVLAVLIQKINQHFRNEEMDDAKRGLYIEYINQKLDGLSLERYNPILSTLDRFNPQNTDMLRIIDLESKSPLLRKALMKYNFQSILAVTLFRADGVEFYEFLNKSMSELIQTMQNTGIDPSQLTKIQLINLNRHFLPANDYLDGLELYGENSSTPVETGIRNEQIHRLSITDYDSFFRLPLVQLIAGKREAVDCVNIDELSDYTLRYLNSLHLSSLHNNGFSLFEDEPLSLIIGPDITKNLDTVLDNGVTDSELDKLYSYISLYYPSGVEKDQILRDVNKRFLQSAEVSLDQKISYLYKYVERVGYEGVILVVNQIYDIDNYRSFRSRLGEKLESYLHGNGSVAKVAIADNLSAKIVDNFKELLATCQKDQVSLQSVSTNLTRKWMEVIFGYSSEGVAAYENASGKFVLTSSGRQVFRTVSDVFTKLHNLSSIHRFAIAHKALFDSGGAFSSEENRRIMAAAIVKSLGLRQGFISDILSTACTDADAEYIGFPASNLIGSLMFQALNVNSIDLEEIKNTYTIINSSYGRLGDRLSNQDILRIINSSTREVTLFGASARKNPNSVVTGIALESDELYYSVSRKLNRLLGNDEAGRRESVNTGTEIDPAIEAVIKGVESTGALGIRALQLATQFQNFSEPINRRLSETFDANPGMDRLFFWENLHRRAEENPQVEEFLRRVQLGRYLGGGSLQTTYAATYTADTGETREIIIKRKNPSVEGLLRRAHATSYDVLEKVSKKKGSRDTVNYAKTGLMLVDLAQKWCIEDLNDTRYLEHDDLFRQTIDKYNEIHEQSQFYAPERVFTELKVKSEELVAGKTVNQVLKDDDIQYESKREIVSRLGEFFLYQLRGNSFTDEQGQRFYLIHSDPHIGNYMVDTSTEGQNKVGVIDRSLYLKLEEKDVQVLEKLIKDSRPTDFVYSFINLVLDKNKDRGAERVKVTAKVFGAVAKEYTSQVSRGKLDKFGLLRALLGELSAQGKEVPLELRLMIRNIGAMQELMKKYGLVLK